MNRIDVENAILATFLDANDLGDDLSHVYPLDISIFTSAFRKRVAVKINGVTDESYGFESYNIEESVKGTRFEHDFMEILAQTSLGLQFSKKYHDKLVEDDRVGELI